MIGVHIGVCILFFLARVQFKGIFLFMFIVNPSLLVSKGGRGQSQELCDVLEISAARDS